MENLPVYLFNHQSTASVRGITMLGQLTKYTDVPVRMFMATIFILSGFGKFGAYASTQGYMEMFGVPGFLLTPTIVLEAGAGLAVLVGFKTRYAALLLTVFTLLTAVIFHSNFADQIQQIMFLKNLAITGGLLLLAKVGAPQFSVDQFLTARK